jgi:two-component system sensor histidine kinase UhpB
MDLRRLLVRRLAGGFALLVLAICFAWVFALRHDVADELAASSQLADLLLIASRAPQQGEQATLVALRRLLAGGSLRHVRVSLEPGDGVVADDAATAPSFGGWLLPSLALPVQRIPLGRSVLVIRPDPVSEVVEKLHDSARVFLVLLLFVAVSLLAVWFAVQRALQPVKELEAALIRLERGEAEPGLPPLELREYERIARAITGLAASLTTARQVQQQLTRRLLAVQEEERGELARELHDEFGQSLAAIGAAAAFIERHAATATAQQLVECAHDVGNESRRIAAHVRGLLAQLRPHGLEGIGMREALAELLAGWQVRLPEMQVDSRLELLPPLSAAAGLALYRGLQEALTNIVRHSRATAVQVSCRVEPEAVVLVVVDDGSGRLESLSTGSGSGLMGMRERLQMVGGSLQVEQAQPQGICLRLTVPRANEGSESDEPECDVG